MTTWKSLSFKRPTTYVYPIIAKEDKDLQKFISKRIKELYDNGTLKKLSKKYFSGSYLPEAKDIKE